MFSLFDIKQFLMIKKKSDIIVFLSSKSLLILKQKIIHGPKLRNKNKKTYIKKKPKEAAKIITGNFYLKIKRFLIHAIITQYLEKKRCILMK